MADVGMTAGGSAQSPTRCMGHSAFGPCQSAPRYSVSTHMDQRDDFRCCGRHLSWLVNYLWLEHGKDVVVVAHLKAGT